MLSTRIIIAIYLSEALVSLAAITVALNYLIA